MIDLREQIARAILMVSQDDSVNVDYAWSVQFEEVQDELLAQADAVLMVLADPPDDVIEQAARRYLDGPGGLNPDHAVLAELARTIVRDVFAAVFGGEQE